MDLPSPSARRYWWVNQNQTFRQEIGGGYLWSPKRRADGAYNRFYDCMREVAPGDLVFSFRNILIQAIGVATGHCFEAPKPSDFGSAGANWDDVGWKVPIRWTTLTTRIRPKDHMTSLAALLPAKYSPLQKGGNGLQSVYLAEVPVPMALELGRLIGPPVDEADPPSLERMGVETGRRVDVGTFSEGQRRYLDVHREQVFLGIAR